MNFRLKSAALMIALVSLIFSALWLWSGKRGWNGASAQVKRLSSPAQPQAPVWAADPALSGESLPQVGRSLFDFLIMDGESSKVPFPFEALMRKIDLRLGCAQDDRTSTKGTGKGAAQSSCLKRVLIPLGRSLQRNAAAPEFFKYPRAVVAVDSEPIDTALSVHARMLLMDRLYLGYQEKADLIEVISYNEAAGRFEFQLVKDYRAGATPKVVYANRAVCVACHQNHAPLFSRPVWDETNANPRIAALLMAQKQVFYGIPVARGVDIPNALDDATERSNLFSVYHRLWREGCGGNAASGVRCRAAAFTAALQYRLTGERAFDDRAVDWREVFLPAFTREWRIRWPAGLAVPNPDIPNRDPLPAERAPQPKGVALTHVAAQFEPLAPRPPLEVWTLDRPETARRFIAGLAGFIAAADVRMLDEHLAARAARARPARRSYRTPCEVAWTDRMLRFSCVSADEASPQSVRLAGRVDLKAGRAIGGEFGTLAVGGAEPLQHLDVKTHALDTGAGRVTLAPASRGMRVRLADGAAVASVEFRWRSRDVRVRAGTHEVTAYAVVNAVDDFAPVRDAIAALAADTTDKGAFSALPFSRARVLAALFAKLELHQREWCCDDASRLPSALAQPQEPPLPAAGLAKDFAAFYPYCARCHATNERSPPNFLAGPGERVAASVKQCAPRIYARLAMWRVAPAARDKTPMPPPVPSVNAIAYSAPASVAGLERTIAELLRAESGGAPRVEQLLARGYEALRPCLPAGL